MARTVDFYFDYLSPYAYLAWRCLPEVIDPRDTKLVARPVLFAGLLNHWGQLGPAEIPPKAEHVFKDIRRFAALRGIPMRSPRYHPFRPLLALRVSLAAVCHDRQKDVISALFNAGWGAGIDLGDAGDICVALNEAGIDGEQLIAAADEPAAKEILRAETEHAIEKGVFGIPTMMVEDELFWGVDQLPYLALYLDGKDPLATAEYSQGVSMGVGVIRPGSVGRGQDN